MSCTVFPVKNHMLVYVITYPPLPPSNNALLLHFLILISLCILFFFFVYVNYQELKVPKLFESKLVRRREQ